MFQNLLHDLYSSALVAAGSPLDGMTRIDDGCSPDSLISKSFAASLAAASLLSRSESALSTLQAGTVIDNLSLVHSYFMDFTGCYDVLPEELTRWQSLRFILWKRICSGPQCCVAGNGRMLSMVSPVRYDSRCSAHIPRITG